MKNPFHKHHYWKIKERSNIIQYDNMGYVLRLFIVECSCGKTKQMWLDSVECYLDNVCRWSEEEAGLPISPKVMQQITTF